MNTAAAHSDDAAPRGFSAAELLLVAGGLFNALLALTNGSIDPFLLPLPLAIGGCVIVASLAIIALTRSRRSSSDGRRLIVIGLAMLALQATAICVAGWHYRFAGTNVALPPSALRELLTVAPVIAFAGIAIVANDRVGRFAIIAATASSLTLGVSAVHATGPRLDVAMFHRDAADALLAGKNPYAISFANPYIDPSRPDDKSDLYAPELQHDGRVWAGYPYPPLMLLALVPGHLLGDARFALAVATSVAALLIAFCHSGRTARVAAALALVSPVGWKVAEIGWTEPIVMLALGLTVLAATCGWRALPVFLGLFLATKQYSIVYLPLCAMVLPRERRDAVRFVTLAVAAALVVTLPLALWDARAFWHSAVDWQMRQPFRPDSLSLMAMVARWTGDAPPLASAWAFAAIVPAWWLTFRFAPRDAAGFAIGVAITSLAFFLTARQAFLNYHTLAAYALLLAAAAITSPSPARRAP